MYLETKSLLLAKCKGAKIFSPELCVFIISSHLSYLRNFYFTCMCFMMKSTVISES